jgi:hypothetical protein
MAGNSMASKRKNITFGQLQNRQTTALVSILILGLVLRVYHVGQSSLWYDEVVTMELARTANPAALLKLLLQIDATRAPLHPIILQGWL